MLPRRGEVAHCGQSPEPRRAKWPGEKSRAPTLLLAVLCRGFGFLFPFSSVGRAAEVQRRRGPYKQNVHVNSTKQGRATKGGCSPVSSPGAARSVGLRTWRNSAMTLSTCFLEWRPLDVLASRRTMVIVMDSGLPVLHTALHHRTRNARGSGATEKFFRGPRTITQRGLLLSMESTSWSAFSWR